MNIVQQAQNRLNATKAALSLFLASIKDENGQYKALTPEVKTSIETHQSAIKVAEEEIVSAQAVLELEQKIGATTTEAKAFQITEEEAKAAKGGDSVKAFVAPRFTRVRNFKSIPGGLSADEQAYRFGRWAMACLAGHRKSMEYCQKHGIDLKTLYDKEDGLVEIKAMGETINTLGGFLVPDEFSNTLIDLRELYGVFRRNAQIEPMARETKNVPRRTGGLTAYWVSEGQQITASDLAWDSIKLVAKKLAALAVFSIELDEDAFINIGDTLAEEIAYAFAVAEDLAGFIGDGTSTYGGVTGVTNKLLNLSATRANIAGLYVGTGNNPSEITLPDLINVAALAPTFVQPGEKKWYMHSTFYWSVCVKLALAAGGVTENEVNNTAYTDNPRFLSYPVEFAQALPSAIGDSALTDTVTVLFGALRKAARLGDRRQVTLAVSDQFKFDTGQICVRGDERLDINVHDVGNVNATASLRRPGPIVGLLMKAS